MDTILDVRNLTVSFRTSGGTLKAVRDISFELERGKTLAIVGESGSGKSVTSKAILGILAGNSIIEGGEILYDGKDLLKISEEEMCTIRGNRISMIFQDPLSSLNPIVKIGRQITEAMLLKDRGNRQSAKKEFNRVLALIRENSSAALGAESSAKVQQLVKTFNDFNVEGTKMETAYNEARAADETLISSAEDFLFLASKNQKLDIKGTLQTMGKKLGSVKNEFLTWGYDEQITALSRELFTARGKTPGKASEVPTPVVDAVRKMDELLRSICSAPKPDFFRIGYYKLKNPDADLHSMSIEQLNEEALAFLDSSFMLDFLEMEQRGAEYSFRTALERKKAVISELGAARETFRNGEIRRGSAKKAAAAAADLVEKSIDRMEIIKDSQAYTFRTALNDAIDRYCDAVKKNPKEEARFARQSRKRERLIARGKTVDWKVVPKVVYDLDDLRENIISCFDRLIAHYEEYIAAADSVDFRERSVGIIDYLKEKASQMVYRVTRAMAKEKAIELMEEVGIPEPRIRYNQYPFEFSGGMRQRIVIAIALAANPDILICDEPTTALDVTIQAQILELINSLKAQRNLSVIFITHDLGVVANMADDIAVMYAGKIIEYGTADDIFYDPRHPYTWALLSSMPDLDTKEKLEAIPGTPPNMIYPPEGDAFAPRNKYALQIDFEQQPPPFRVSPTHWAATWLLHPDAPHVDPPKIIVDRIERMTKKAGGEI